MAKDIIEPVYLIVFAIILFIGVPLGLIALRSGKNEDNFRHFVLKDNAYSNTLLPTYSRKGGWPIPLPKSKENYDKLPRNLKDSMLQMTKKCSSVADCSKGQICVEPSYYGGGQHGYCMYSNEPGIPRDLLASVRAKKESKENFSHFQQRPCPPSNFFNESVGQCQPIFQGSSTAKAINSIRPAPPPYVSLPGTTFPGYGSGATDPVDVPFQKLELGVGQIYHR